MIHVGEDKRHISWETADEHSAFAEVLSERVIRFFKRYNNDYFHSAAIDDAAISFYAALECQPDISVDDAGHLVIVTGALKVIIDPKTFMTDIYDRQGNPVCTDYRGQRNNPYFADETKEDEGNAAAHHPKGIDQWYFDMPVQCVKNFCEGQDHVYGCGDKTGFLDKSHYAYINWNTDDFKPHVDSMPSLYKSIPIFIVKAGNAYYGIFFDNSDRSYVDFGKENPEYYFFGADDGNLDYYFIYGNTMREVVMQITQLTGKMPRMPRWALGYHQSRWGYASEQDFAQLAKKFRDYRIPCDVFHMDIDYMDGYRVFTWDQKAFPNPPAYTKQMHDMGYHLVAITDPGVKADPKYYVYKEGLKNRMFATSPVNRSEENPQKGPKAAAAKSSTSGKTTAAKKAEAYKASVYFNEVWPGVSAYPDFTNEKTRTWWAGLHTFYKESGLDGVWNDMNEPASFVGPLPDDVVFTREGQTFIHKHAHNLYGHFMAQASYEGMKRITGKRPFIITRACFAGTQKYSTVWTGDNHSIWAHLQMAIPQLCNLGLSGMSFAGTDIGGFSSDTTPELMARWIEMSALAPMCRNHSARGTRKQEPWMFDEKIICIYRKYVELRYELLPYLYDTMVICSEIGMPMMRPLVLMYDQDPVAATCNDEFMVGNNILVAPVVTQGSEYRSVYLPAGDDWYDITDGLDRGKRIHGGKVFTVHAPLDTCPMYVKAGTMLPVYPLMQYTGQIPISETELTVYVYPKKAKKSEEAPIEYRHIVDNGEDFEFEFGQECDYVFSYSKGACSIAMSLDGYEDGHYKEINFIVC